MILTEEEARKQRCCGPVGCGSVSSRDGWGHTERACIASACMAWRWVDALDKRISVPGSDGTRFSIESLDDGGMRKTTVEVLRRIRPDERRGYCGLAGKP